MATHCFYYFSPLFCFILCTNYFFFAFSVCPLYGLMICCTRIRIFHHLFLYFSHYIRFPLRSCFKYNLLRISKINSTLKNVDGWNIIIFYHLCVCVWRYEFVCLSLLLQNGELLFLLFVFFLAVEFLNLT